MLDPVPITGKRRNVGGRALVVSSGPPLSLKVIHALAEMRWEACLLDIGPLSVARRSRHCRASAILPREEVEPERFLECLNDLVLRWNIDVVVPADIGAASLVAGVIERIRGAAVFPVSEGALLERLDDKWRCSQLLAEHGIPTPKAALVRRDVGWSEFDALRDVGRWVVKPLHGESGHGVRTVASTRALEDAVERTLADYPDGALIQEYAAGRDADVSVLAVGGRVLASIVQVRPDGKRLEFVECSEAERMARDLIGATGYTGVMNIDIRIDEANGAVTILECNPRFWYTLQASAWRGVNFVDYGIRVARGENLEQTSVRDGSYFYHRIIATEIVARPWRWREVPDYNWHGFWQALSDPGPFLSARYAQLVRRPQRTKTGV